jgi:hypothetical protein
MLSSAIIIAVIPTVSEFAPEPKEGVGVEHADTNGMLFAVGEQAGKGAQVDYFAKLDV